MLERQGRAQGYLYLAEAEGQIEQYVTMLVRLGRVQEAVDYGLQSLNSTQEALALATWMADLALGMGETGRALDATLIAFRRAPELVAYQRVEVLAGERWPEFRTALLAHLRRGRSYFPQGPVAIFLREGLAEDAIRAVEGSAS
jgi:uncharacterized Zn finger protein